MKHYLEIISEEQAIAMKNLKPGDKVECAGVIEEVVSFEPPSLVTRAPDGQESKHLCMIGVNRHS